MDIAGIADWSTNNSCVATVTQEGLVTFSGAGLVQLTASWQGTIQTTTIPVSGDPLNIFTGVNIPRANETLAQGTEEQTTASNTITGGPAYVINCGASAAFQASNEITLTPGFEALAGSTFSASIQ